MTETSRSDYTLAEMFESDWESDKHLYYTLADVDDLSPVDVVRLFFGSHKVISSDEVEPKAIKDDIDSPTV